MSNYYFCTNGDYGPVIGDAYDTIAWHFIIPANTWTPDMWDLLDKTSAKHRLDIARHYNVGVHIMSNEVCIDCKLTTEQLTGQWMVNKDNKPMGKEDMWVAVEPVYSDGASQTCW